MRRLRVLGFSGPHPGGRHSYMKKGQLKLRLPNPHQRDIGVPLLKEILRQAGVPEKEWAATEVGE